MGGKGGGGGFVKRKTYSQLFCDPSVTFIILVSSGHARAGSLYPSFGPRQRWQRPATAPAAEVRVHGDVLPSHHSRAEGKPDPEQHHGVQDGAPARHDLPGGYQNVGAFFNLVLFLFEENGPNAAILECKSFRVRA